MTHLCATAAFFDELDNAILDLVLAYLPSPLDANLRATCWRMRKYVEAPKQCDMDKMLKRGAKLGSRDLWDLAFTKVLRDEHDRLSCALYFAAKYHRLDFCLFAMCKCCPEYIRSSSDLDGIIFAMVDGAAEGGWRDFCLLAREFVLKEFDVQYLKKLSHDQNLSTELVMRFLSGAKCRILKRDYFVHALEGAARGFHADLCEFVYNDLLKKKPYRFGNVEVINCFIRGLVHSDPVSPHKYDIIELIQKISRDARKNVVELTIEAAMFGRVDLCEIAFAQANIAQVAFNTALCHQKADVCEWAFAHGAVFDPRVMGCSIMLWDTSLFVRISVDAYFREIVEMRAGFADFVISRMKYQLDFHAGSLLLHSQIEKGLATFKELCGISDP